MLYTLEHGEVISKQDALGWALEALPYEWRDLIERVRQDRLVHWNEPTRPGSVDRAVRFVEYVQERADQDQLERNEEKSTKPTGIKSDACRRARRLQLRAVRRRRQPHPDRSRRRRASVTDSPPANRTVLRSRAS
jgi:hypothetical protein